MRVWLVALMLAQSATPTVAQKGTVAGRVVSADGAPVQDQRVAVIAVDESPRATASLVVIGQTDKEGRYALEDVPPGRYFIMVGSLDAPAYFPGVWDPKRATAVTVNAGERREAVDIRVPIVPDSVKVRGRLTRASHPTAGVANADVRLAGRGRYTAISDADGYFEFPAVHPGLYEASAATTEGRSTTVIVGAMDVTDVVLVSGPGFRVAGEVVREGANTIQPFKRLRLAAPGGTVSAEIKADGRFDIPYIPRGNYQFEVEPSIVTAPNPLMVQTDIVALRVTIPRGVRVAGQIAFQNGNSREALPTEIVFGGPARGATAIAPDGTFEFAVVTPGKYQAELRPHPSTRMPKLEIEVRAEDLTGLRWVIPDSANVNLRALLESSDPLDQAWAGWTAGEARRTDMIPLLEKALVSRLAASAAGDRENVAIDTISDALIRLDAKLDLATIRSLYSPRPAQALVLLSRMDSSVNGFLFELLETQQGLHWFATANLLLKQKTPGLAASLVKGMRVEAHVSVCDPGRPCASVGGGMSGTGSRGYGHLDNYPPWPGYILSRDSGDLLARGPTPVFVQREVALPGTMPRMADGFQSSRTAPTTEDRIAYVRVLAPGARAGLSQREDRIVEWKGREALDAEIDTFLDGISTRYSMMLQDLLAAGVLTKQEAEGLAKPPVTLVIDDRHTVR